MPEYVESSALKVVDGRVGFLGGGERRVVIQISAYTNKNELVEIKRKKGERTYVRS